MKYLFPLALICLLLSCKKETTNAIAPVLVPFSEATYNVIVSLNWTMPALTVPSGAHVTTLIGMVHAKDTFLWQPDKLATTGLKNVAETGNITQMNVELDSILVTKKALNKFTIAAVAVTSTTSSTINFNTNYPLISFASMIAPSPDWFMGIHDVNLFNNSKWVTDSTINLNLYDAGTKQGNAFAYNFPASSPQENVIALSTLNASVLANVNSSIGAIGTVRFIKN